MSYDSFKDPKNIMSYIDYKDPTPKDMPKRGDTLMCEDSNCPSKPRNKVFFVTETSYDSIALSPNETEMRNDISIAVPRYFSFKYSDRYVIRMAKKLLTEKV